MTSASPAGPAGASGAEGAPLKRGPSPRSLLLLFGAVVGAGVWYHEPWFNEAHAWQLARESDLPTLLFHALRYEGSTGLWHLLLWLPAHAGLPYATLQVVATLSGLLGAWQILRHAPFGPVTRGLLPFGCFLLFDCGVVARSYCLLPPLLFLVARAWPLRLARPWRAPLALALLAQANLHGLAIAAGFMACHVAGVLRGGGGDGARPLRAHALPALAFLAVLALDAWQLAPPLDLAAGGEWSLDPVHWLTMAGVTLDMAFVGGVVAPIVILAVSLSWFHRRGFLSLYLVPTSLVLALFATKRVNGWHVGILYLVWLTVFWIAADAARRGGGDRSRAAGRARTALLFTAVANALFAGVSLAYDVSQPYSGARDAARYLRRRVEERARIHAAGFSCEAILPYFDRNVFENWNGGRPPALWRWSLEFKRATARRRVAAGDPDVIVWGVTEDEDLPVPKIPGYEEVARFPGGIFCKMAVFEPDSFVVLERRPK